MPRQPAAITQSDLNRIVKAGVKAVLAAGMAKEQIVGITVTPEGSVKVLFGNRSSEDALSCPLTNGTRSFRNEQAIAEIRQRICRSARQGACALSPERPARILLQNCAMDAAVHGRVSGLCRRRHAAGDEYQSFAAKPGTMAALIANYYAAQNLPAYARARRPPTAISSSAFGRSTATNVSRQSSAIT